MYWYFRENLNYSLPINYRFISPLVPHWFLSQSWF